MSRPLDKKQQILQAAAEEFQKAGYLGASMDQIAATANVSKRTVYNHFESKQALFRAILDWVLSKLKEAVAVTFNPSKPLKGQLLDLARAECKFLQSEEYMRLLRLVIGETIRDPDLAEYLADNSNQISVFDDFMQAASIAGALNTDDYQEVSHQFVSLIKYRAFWPYMMSGQVITDEEMENIAFNSAETIFARYGNTSL
ncbi:TetR/AcrR family transcriptional regulator [Sneathiella limimaris]|uniref:TetR/AcrR family transcriptional regulator n=1 Tax=Sneathiella limimaris TaxID=1964213 RepID=UPI00146CBD95|nr:TetR/AcrR family transcriptional regulator [Sneathiella limimaris]